MSKALPLSIEWRAIRIPLACSIVARRPKATLQVVVLGEALQGDVGDASLNLGRYRDAFAAFDRAAEIAPSVATYARIGFARELLGRPGQAEQAIGLAVDLDPVGYVRFDPGTLHSEKHWKQGFLPAQVVCTPFRTLWRARVVRE